MFKIDHTGCEHEAKGRAADECAASYMKYSLLGTVADAALAAAIMRQDAADRAVRAYSHANPSTPFSAFPATLRGEARKAQAAGTGAKIMWICPDCSSVKPELVEEDSKMAFMGQDLKRIKTECCGAYVEFRRW